MCDAEGSAGLHMTELPRAAGAQQQPKVSLGDLVAYFSLLSSYFNVVKQRGKPGFAGMWS